jgi:tetratricopeptide (TPR) repeat protein
MRARRWIGAACIASLVVAACGWDPSRPFEREAPQVNEALRALDGGDATAAASTLEDYLSTGKCESGNIGTPDRVRKRPNGSFDLGLALFRIGEAHGQRFGDEELDAGSDPDRAALRDAEIDCALRIVRAFADDASNPMDLRARARYLEGNLLFLARRYEEAVKAYDQALVLAPGMHDAGDPVGRDAAWNRAIAMRRIEDKNRDAGQDGSSDASRDGGGDGGGEGGADSGGGDSGRGGDDGGARPDAGQDAASPPNTNDAAPPPPTSQDDVMLDQLERTPTLQQHIAKEQHKQRPRVIPGGLDK